MLKEAELADWVVMLNKCDVYADEEKWLNHFLVLLNYNESFSNSSKALWALANSFSWKALVKLVMMNVWKQRYAFDAEKESSKWDCIKKKSAKKSLLFQM